MSVANGARLRRSLQVPAAGLLLAAACGNDGASAPSNAPQLGGPSSAAGVQSTGGFSSSGESATGGTLNATPSAVPPVVPPSTGSGGAAGGPTAQGTGGAASNGGAPPSAFGGGGNADGGTVGGGGAVSSTGGASHVVRDHCVDGYAPHPSDETMKDGPVEYSKNGDIDLTVQPEVIQWLEDNVWQEAHFQWHNIRRCNGGGSMVRSGLDICKYTEMIPTDQECKSDGDGFQFLAMHRHMIQSLKQLWPKHSEQFTAFPAFPQKAEDVPQQWRASWSAFSANDLANAKLLDEVDKNMGLSQFADEGKLGRWIQCFAPQFSGLHGALHFKWVRPGNTDHGLGNQFRNIDNYMFWKMHGWIDLVWEKWRISKSLSPDEPRLKDAILTQCREMDKLATLIDPSLQTPSNPTEPLPTETGEFHEKVRPIFATEKNKCTGCHNTEGPEGNLTLGGNRSSKDIVAGLVNKASSRGGQFKLVVPGEPDQSWLYLKASGKAASAGCVSSNIAMCRTQVMPPESSEKVTATEAELAALRTWILNGAPPPP